MNVTATLICEDVRFEASGALTLVGVYNEQLVAPPGNGPIHLERLAMVVVDGGLRGVRRAARWRADGPLRRSYNLETVLQRELEALIGMPTEALPLSANDVTIEAGDGVPAMETRFGVATVFPRPADELMHGFAFEVKVPGAPHAPRNVTQY